MRVLRRGFIKNAPLPTRTHACANVGVHACTTVGARKARESYLRHVREKWGADNTVVADPRSEGDSHQHEDAALDKKPYPPHPQPVCGHHLGATDSYKSEHSGDHHFTGSLLHLHPGEIPHNHPGKIPRHHHDEGMEATADLMDARSAKQQQDRFEALRQQFATDIAGKARGRKEVCRCRRSLIA